MQDLEKNNLIVVLEDPLDVSNLQNIVQTYYYIPTRWGIQNPLTASYYTLSQLSSMNMHILRITQVTQRQDERRIKLPKFANSNNP